jgi:UDP-hydrolysing UDP-N-acetyl-D-glucosamine 2-epimerase
MRRKICVVITARPSYSRIKTVLKAIELHPELELQLVVASSALLEKYGMAVNFMELDGFSIAAKVHNLVEGENLIAAVKTTGLGAMELSTIFDYLKPEIVVTVADRYETIATAICASLMQIPLAHIQGGEITGNIDDKIRHAITKLADLHFVSTDDARNRVLRLGEAPETVHQTGCPSIDIARQVLDNPSIDFDLYTKYGGVGSFHPVNEPYLVVMQHPVTTEYEQAREQIEATLNAIVALNIPTFWFWPNPDTGSDETSKGIRSFREQDKNVRIHFFKNMDPVDFLKLIKNAACLIGNSSVGIRECSFLGIPVVNIGSRQLGRERGRNVIDVGYNTKSIIEAVKTHLHNDHFPSEKTYGDGRAGPKVATILATTDLTYFKRMTY